MSTQASSSTTYKSWKSWFNSRESATIINQANQERLFQIFNSTVSNEKCKNEVEGHEETVFLYRQSFGENRINTFHHMKVVGGNLYSPKEEFGFVQGVDESTTCIMTPDYDTLINVSNQNPEAIPKIDHLLAVETEDDVKSLVVGQTTVFNPRNFTPVPPFLVDTISISISTNDGNSRMVLIDTAKAIKAFDTTHATDTNYKEKAKSKSKDILAWLYLVGEDKVHSTPTMGCNSRPLLTEFQNLDSKILNQVDLTNARSNVNTSKEIESILKRPLEILATSSCSTHEFMDRLTKIQTQAQEKTARSFKKVAPKYQKMLLIASSQGEVIPTTLRDEAMSFFSQSSVLNAQIYLNSILESEQIECFVSSALTTSLMHGSLLWLNALTPSGLASSVICSSDIMKNDTLHEGIVLDYSIKHEMSSSSLEKLTKSQVLFPTDIESSIDRIRALESLVRLFLGESSLAQQGLKKLINLCTDNKRLLKTKLFLDKMFIAKLHYMIDDRLNQWLSQCCRANEVGETNIQLVDFSSIFFDLQLSKFHCTLPPSISRITPKTPKDSNPAPFNQDSENSKKRKKQQAERVKNTNPICSWKLRLNETWETVFRNKTKDGPLLSMGCKPCLRWHAKLDCFDDCNNIASHTTLCGSDKEKTDAFIKEIRGE